MLASVKKLLTSIVDYAGLFPPAKLSLERAIDTYNQARYSSENWMLGQFVLPISRLCEFQQLISARDQQYSLSLILSKEWRAELTHLKLENPILENPILENPVKIASLEFPPLSPSEIQEASTLISASIDTFFEIPFSADLESYLPILQNSQAAAKIRTGGIIPDLFPSVEKLTEFVCLFATHRISFKATAGLHHPFVGQYALTYEPNSAIESMHGFLNLAILAGFAFNHKITQAEGLMILQTSSAHAFQFSDREIRWRDQSLSLAEIEKTRQQFFRSFGSCSFHEPITDLKTLKLLS